MVLLASLFDQSRDSLPPVTPEEIRLYEAHFALLVEWNAKINLVSRKSIEKAFGAHYVDSIYISDFAISADKQLPLFDVGTGAGFPGVIAAIRYPNRSVTLYEKSQKKLLFLHEVLAALKLSNLELGAAIPERARDGIYLARAVLQRHALFPFMRVRMTPQSFLITNLGGATLAEPPPHDFRMVRQVNYGLPQDCGGRKAELLSFVPRGTF